MPQLLEVKDLSKSFTIHHLNKSMHAVGILTFHLKKVNSSALLGKSGSGKSTVLKSIYRTYLPEKGAILYNSEKFGTVDLVAAIRKRSLIFT